MFFEEKETFLKLVAFVVAAMVVVDFFRFHKPSETSLLDFLRKSSSIKCS